MGMKPLKALGVIGPLIKALTEALRGSNRGSKKSRKQHPSSKRLGASEPPSPSCKGKKEVSWCFACFQHFFSVFRGQNYEVGVLLTLEEHRKN